jgi:hypothetical protein
MQQQRGAVEYPYLPCLRALSKREGLKLAGMSSNESPAFKFIAGRAPTTVSPPLPNRRRTPQFFTLSASAEAGSHALASRPRRIAPVHASTGDGERVRGQ